MQNLLSFIRVLGFEPLEGAINTFKKHYTQGYQIEIRVDLQDYKKSIINWGNKIQVKRSTTSNFSQEETLVVLECVDRLLEKGYKPEDIILEDSWKLGHKGKGFLDICVKKDEQTFLMIECKTPGKEYEKELRNLYKDGGQLFSYFQQDKSAQYLVLYTSQIENDKIDYKNDIVVVEQSYRETNNIKDLFDRWNKFTKSTGIFNPWVRPYNFESKALTLSQLKPITEGDSSFIFNRFLEILRHNAVSDKPNAFNRIFTLFLCKVKDEDRQENEELDFQWKEGEDSHTSFQVRLSDLYKSAMKEFLEKEITDLSDDDFESKYGILSQEIKTQLKAEFIKLRLQKNNEFAIKDVFDQETFEENAIVLKEVVELLQPFKFRYNKKQPFLGDFFELLLTTGLKQEVGQFFTPVPIARFICRSVPMQESVNSKLKQGETNELLPNIIDYACGSGHFLTEAMEEIHKIIQNTDSSKLTPKTARTLESWKINQFDWAFDHIYGVERDYRLVKTTKVGCYLHGDGIARIIHGDGLDSFDSKSYQGKLKLNEHRLENPKFDFILSNPPYSVSSFKGNLKNKYASSENIPEDKKPFELYKNLTDQSSEIEVLFAERTKQLLKDGGIAAIILPSSILSNTGLYTKARELMLKYFEFISIVELGSNTFMATGTNTVILFLRRRNNYHWQTVETNIQKAFETKKDLTINGIENLISKYLENTEQEVELKEYIEKFQKDELEKEKLLYFALAYPQKIVLINSGQKRRREKIPWLLFFKPPWA
jgi:type I restriction enzyme M protein